MPSITVSTTDEKFAKIIDALDHSIDREPEDETDAHFYKRWLKSKHIELDFKYRRRQAEGAVAPDPDIAEIT